MTGFGPSKPPRKNMNAEDNFEVVTFESRKKKAKNSQNDKKKTEEEEPLSREEAEREMKGLRHEVLKFAMKGSNKDEARKARTELAIKLGAKKPKNYNVNYKKLQVQNKIQKEKESRIASTEEARIERLMTIKKKSKTKKELLAIKKKKKEGKGKAARKKRNKEKNKSGSLLSGYGKVN